MIDRVPTPIPAGGYQQRRHSDDDRLHLTSQPCFSASQFASSSYAQPLHFKMTPLPTPTPPSLLKRAKSLEQATPRRHVHSQPQSPRPYSHSHPHTHALPPSHHHASGSDHTSHPTTTTTTAGHFPSAPASSSTRRHSATACDISPPPHQRQRSSSLLSVSSIPSPPLPVTPGLNILPELIDEPFELFPPQAKSAVEGEPVMGDGIALYNHDSFPEGIGLGGEDVEMGAIERERCAVEKRRIAGEWDAEANTGSLLSVEKED
ncbi:hypothetical protein IAR50_001997 [Cryptococcus sp. DSM 104548]